jgi:hypothetical protein
VKEGTWMAIYQGVIDASDSIIYEAMDADYQVLYTEEHELH